MVLSGTPEHTDIRYKTNSDFGYYVISRADGDQRCVQNPRFRKTSKSDSDLIAKYVGIPAEMGMIEKSYSIRQYEVKDVGRWMVQKHETNDSVCIDSSRHLLSAGSPDKVHGTSVNSRIRPPVHFRP